MKKLIPYVIVFVIGFAACAYTISHFGFAVDHSGQRSLLENLTTHPANPVVVKGQNPIADAVDRVGPAVVTIWATVEHEVQSPFYGGQPQIWPGTVTGSGIIISSDGYIMTNNHVVADAKKIGITLKDGRKFDARLVGRDPITEVAVLKINDGKLPVAKLGNSDAIRVGDWAIAIGNPFNLENTVTVGVISAKGRNEPVQEGRVLSSLIQTDAAINPGNSGGALCNIEGEVIGINTMIYSHNDSNIGIGFAIPINSAKDIAKEIIANGKAIHPYLGVQIATLADADAYLATVHQQGFKGDKGAVIAELIPNGPAARAGLLQKDIITEIDREPINDSDDLLRIIKKHKVGQQVKVTVWRSGKFTSITITFAEMPAEMPVMRPATRLK